MREPRVCFSYSPHILCGREARNTVMAGVKRPMPQKAHPKADGLFCRASTVALATGAVSRFSQSHSVDEGVGEYFSPEGVSPRQGEYTSKVKGSMSISAWREIVKFRKGFPKPPAVEPSEAPKRERPTPVVKPVIAHPSVAPTPRFYTWPGTGPNGAGCKPIY